MRRMATKLLQSRSEQSRMEVCYLRVLRQTPLKCVHVHFELVLLAFVAVIDGVERECINLLII